MKRTGEILKKAREDKKLSLHEVALFLKINSRVLQAIEDGDLSQLPARTFLRGFIQSYAKFLKLDASFVLQVFSEENSPPPSAQASLNESIPSVAPEKIEETAQAAETRQAAEKKAEIDIVSLEKSILTKSQVAQDKLGFKTIAVSIVGLLLVVVLYFANNVIKKYQREAQVEPVGAIASVESQDATNDGADDAGAPVAQANVPGSNDSPIEKTEKDTSKQAAEAPASTSATARAPISNTTTPNSVQNLSYNPINSSTFIAPITLPTTVVAAKTKVPEPADASLSQKTTTTATTPKPVDKKLEVIPVATPDKKEDPKIEGKLIEVIVEANDAVEIEYSSSKTSPQKMVLKAEQIHTFKSRSGVRLKISNGGAVNIIMNGRDLGVPGAAGQPIQVTY